MDKQGADIVQQMCSEFLEVSQSEASEIISNAEERANQNFENQINNIREKLEVEYQREMKAIESDDQIQKAKISNAAKLEVLKYQKKALNESLEAARNQLNEFSKGPEYPKLLTKLIAEGLVQLKERKVRLTVRKSDYHICKEAVPEAVAIAKRHIEGIDFEIIVEQERFLPAEPHCAGGVVLTCHKGKIRLSNILNERLRLAYDGTLPTIRRVIFNEQ